MISGRSTPSTFEQRIKFVHTRDDALHSCRKTFNTVHVPTKYLAWDDPTHARNLNHEIVRQKKKKRTVCNCYWVVAIWLATLANCCASYLITNIFFQFGTCWPRKLFIWRKVMRSFKAVPPCRSISGGFANLWNNNFCTHFDFAQLSPVGTWPYHIDRNAYGMLCIHCTHRRLSHQRICEKIQPVSSAKSHPAQASLLRQHHHWCLCTVSASGLTRTTSIAS